MQRNLPGSLLIARCKKGSNNQRDDFLHKLSKIYANNYNNICIEDLDVRGLKKKGHNTGMHRSIHDAAWAKFAFMLSYKAWSAGRKLISVDPKNTTQRCSNCGSIVRKELSDRAHVCPYCGFVADRDYNSSRNILIAGMEQPWPGAKTSTSHICEASFGDEVGSPTLQGRVVHIRIINLGECGSDPYFLRARAPEYSMERESAYRQL